MKEITKLILLIYCSLATFLGMQCYQHRTIEIKIHTPHDEDFVIRMPCKDKQLLTQLFHKMMIREDGAYTLFGCKPVHMFGYVKPFAPSNLRFFSMSIRPSNITTYKGWKTWEKYAHLLKNSQFLLWAEENPCWAEPHDAVSILLVHKKQFDETVRLYKKDFSTVLQKNDLNGEMLLRESKEKPLLKTVLKGHDGLIGTLFGYGRSNAWLFEKRKNGEHIYLSPLWDPELYEFMWNNRNSKNLHLALDYPSFCCDPNSVETQQLKKDFLEVREKILEYYKGKDFLEATLGLLLDQQKEF